MRWLLIAVACFMSNLLWGVLGMRNNLLEKAVTKH